MNKSRVEKLEKILKVDKGTNKEFITMERFTHNARLKLLSLLNPKTHKYKELSKSDRDIIDRYNKEHRISNDTNAKQKLIGRCIRSNKR